MQKQVPFRRGILGRPERAAYLFIAPSMLILLIFVFIPLIASFFISFTNLNLFFTKSDFVGFSNYSKAFQNARVWNSFKNTLYFVLLEVPLQVFVGLIIASALTANKWFEQLMRSVFFLPVLCSLTSVGLIWSLILDPTIGMIPYWLSKLGFPKIVFLKDKMLAMPILALITVWKNSGQTMVVMGAGLTGISSSYYEAARIDGASKTQMFLHITVPLLLPTIGFCLITNLIGSMQMFDIAFVTTAGGPMNSTETAVMYLYNRAFTSPYELGMGCAISVLLFIIICAFSLTLNKYINHKEGQLYGRDNGR